jgi:hypothetical protein
LLLSRNGALNVLKEFVVNELADFVFFGEYLVNAVFVFSYATGQIARYADVKAAGMAAHDVNPSSFGYHRE